MWYLLSTAKARVSKGNYISGFPINETALYANRDYFKEEASIYVTGKKTAKETNTNEEEKGEKVKKEEKDEKEENDTTTASRSKYVVPTETKEEELPMDKKKENASACILNNQFIYIIGGYCDIEFLNDLEKYTIATDSMETIKILSE